MAHVLKTYLALCIAALCGAAYSAGLPSINTTVAYLGRNQLWNHTGILFCQNQHNSTCFVATSLPQNECGKCVQVL